MESPKGSSEPGHEQPGNKQLGMSSNSIGVLQSLRAIVRKLQTAH